MSEPNGDKPLDPPVLPYASPTRPLKKFYPGLRAAIYADIIAVLVMIVFAAGQAAETHAFEFVGIFFWLAILVAIFSFLQVLCSINTAAQGVERHRAPTIMALLGFAFLAAIFILVLAPEGK